MVETEDGSGKKLRSFAFKVLKAAVKGSIFLGVYLVLWQFLAPTLAVVPSAQQMVETFIIVYLVLLVVGELASGTIFQHFFNVAKALFAIVYLIFSLGSGVVELPPDVLKSLGLPLESLIVDLRLFLVAAILLGLLGLARAVMQTLNYMSERAELTQI